MTKTIKSLLLTVSALLLVISASAQITTSALNGKVADAKGEAIPGAAIIAVHNPSGTTYFAVVNSEGRFAINGMRSGGPYSVEVSCLGYQTVTYTDITLQLAETYALNSVLNDDTQMLSEAVVISTASSRFAAEKTGAATNISNEQITALPTVSRSITDVTKLSPYGGNGMTFAGADGRTANFTVDGANFNNNFGLSDKLPGGGSPISLDAIEEVQVVISPYDVRQTGFVGGGVNAITKSGTNTFKGTAYYYHRNENMRGDVVSEQAVSGARDRDRQTTYGFTLGGPIVKNKLFFFANFEMTNTPTVANRWRATEDGMMDENKNLSRTTIDDMDRVKNHVMNTYGYNPGSYTDFPAENSNMKALGRIDWNINDANKLSIRYNYTINNSWISANASSMDGGTRSAYSRTSKYSNIFSGSMYSQKNIVSTWSVNLNSRISENLHNEFLATYSVLDDARGSNSDEFPFIDIRKDDGATVLPYMSLGYELFTWKNAVHNRVLTAKDDITYYMGAHKITGGVSFEYQMADNAYMRNGTGYYRYNSVDDFINGNAPEVVCLTYGYDGNEDPAARVRFNKAGIYGQDEWSINDNFKLTYGIRFDGLFFNNADIMTNNAIKALDYSGYGFHLNEGAEITAEQEAYAKRIDTGLWPSSKITVSPRIGFNWDVYGDKTLKVRGGTGFFSGRLPLVFFTNMPTNSGMVQYQAQMNAKHDLIKNLDGKMNVFSGGLVTDANGHATIDALKEKLIGLGTPNTISPEDGTVGSSIAAVDPKFKMPQVWKTSLAVDYSFPTSFPFSITAEGVFNKTINAVCISDWSIKPVESFARFNGPDNRPMYPAEHKYTHFDTKKNVVANMPNAYVLTNTNQGYGYIASVTLNARPIEALKLTAAYTHTASYELTGMPGSDASSAFTYVPGYEGPNSAHLHASQYVTPNRFFASATYNDECNNSYSLFYETWQGGSNYSYMYVNDMNGDGYNYDSIYIPKAEDEIRFVSEADSDRFWAYLQNDKYLSSHKGQYAEAYRVYSPWVHRLDFHYSHDFKLKIGSTINTLQLNFDVKNILNMFNSNWGVSKYMNSKLNSGRILKYEGVDVDGYPTFSTPKDVNGSVPVWTPNIAIGQCWYAQIGFKYLFN